MEKENCIQINLLPSTSDSNILDNLENVQNTIVEYFGNRNARKNPALPLIIVNHDLTENDKQIVYKICLDRSIACTFTVLQEFTFNIYIPEEEK